MYLVSFTYSHFVQYIGANFITYNILILPIIYTYCQEIIIDIDYFIY